MALQAKFHQRVTVLRDFVQPALSYLWKTPNQSQVLELVTMETEAESLLESVHHWLNERRQDLAVDKVSADMKSFVAEKKIKPQRFFHFMRKALTGEVQGPPVAEMISVLGERNVSLRLQTAIDVIRRSKPTPS